MQIGLDRLQVLAAAKTGARKTLQLIASLGYEQLFHMTDCTDKEDIAVGITLLHHIRHCDGRIDVAGSTATGEDQIHMDASCRFLLSRYLEMFATIPISPRFTASAVPP